MNSFTLSASCGIIIQKIPTSIASRRVYASATEKISIACSLIFLNFFSKSFFILHTGIFITKANASPKKTGVSSFRVREIMPIKNSGLTARAITAAAKKAVKSIVFTVFLSISLPRFQSLNIVYVSG